VAFPVDLRQNLLKSCRKVTKTEADGSPCLRLFASLTYTFLSISTVLRPCGTMKQSFLKTEAVKARKKTGQH
jgi:hypothetical protein